MDTATHTANPILTPLSGRTSPQGMQSSLASPLMVARQKLIPAPAGEIVGKLTPVLALVAPAGMSQADRTEWLAAATDSLRDIPADLLTEALQAARRRVDHPAKIVPFVTDYCEQRIKWRRDELARAERMAQPPRPVAIPDNNNRHASPEDVAEILERYGLKSKVQPRDRKPPTVEDYMSLGHSRESAEKFVAQYHSKPDAQKVRAA